MGLGRVATLIVGFVLLLPASSALFSGAAEWSILGGGRYQFDLITAGAVLGGHVRVGMEDSIYLRKGKLADTNAEQVAKIVRILEELSREPATPAETRETLDLKGLDQVAF